MCVVNCLRIGYVERSCSIFKRFLGRLNFIRDEFFSFRRLIQAKLFFFFFLEGVENRFETREVEKFQTLNNSRGEEGCK